MKIHDMDDDDIEWKPEMFLPFTPEEEAEAKALIDASFTAKDLQRYTAAKLPEQGIGMPIALATASPCCNSGSAKHCAGS